MTGSFWFSSWRAGSLLFAPEGSTGGEGRDSLNSKSRGRMSANCRSAKIAGICRNNSYIFPIGVWSSIDGFHMRAGRQLTTVHGKAHSPKLTQCKIATQSIFQAPSEGEAEQFKRECRVRCMTLVAAKGSIRMRLQSIQGTNVSQFSARLASCLYVLILRTTVFPQIDDS